MHFNVYIDDQMGMELNQLVKETGKTRNALIREVLSEWLQHHVKQKWPQEILEFEGVKDGIEFESYRKQLQLPKDDPLS